MSERIKKEIRKGLKRKGFKKSEIIKNPNPKAKIKYIALINPIGDRTFGYLNWDKKKGFKTEIEAKKWVEREIKNSLKGKRIKAIKEFEQTINMAELKALSKVSLERPLTNKEYNRMMKLKKKVFK